MLVPHFIKNIFRSRLTLVSSNVIITIKIDVKNHKKINKQERLFKKNLNGLSNGQKGNEISYEMEKKIICKYSLFKKCFQTIIIPFDCFC